MKQTILLIGLMLYFSCRAFIDPFWAVLMYYGLAVLRPQYIWQWSLPKGIRWSLYAALVAIGITILKHKLLSRKKLEPIFMPLLFIFAFFLAGSYYGALDKEVAGKAGWEYAKILIMLVIASYTVTELRHVRYLAWMIFICLAYVSFEMNDLYLFHGNLFIYHHGFGGFDNNGAALMLAMGIPFGFFFFFAERRWWRWIYLFSTIPMIHAVMCSFSRGGMLSALVIGVCMFVQMLKRKPIITTVLGLGFLFIVSILAGPAVRERFDTISEKFHDASAQSRFMSWRAGYRIAMDYPVFGVGLRNSNLITHEYGADKEGRTIHNVYLQIAADSGIGAASIFVMLLGLGVAWFVWSASLTYHHLNDYELRWHHYISLACLWSLCTFAFGSIFLSCEAFELCYLLMLMAAVSPALAGAGVPSSVRAKKEDVSSSVPVVPVLSNGEIL